MDNIIEVLIMIGATALICYFIIANPTSKLKGKTDSKPLNIEMAMNAIKEGNLALLKSMISRGLSVNSKDQDSNNNTLLHYACINGEKDIVKYLLNKGAEINVGNNDNHTPLLVSLLFGHDECVILLLENGAVDITTPSVGNTILHDIAASININFMIDFSQKWKENQLNKENPILNELIESQINQSLQTEISRLKGANIRIVKHLLSKGFDFTRVNFHGHTVMDFVRGCENHDMGFIMATHEADLDEEFPKRATALSMAVIANQPEIISKILKTGKNINEREPNTGQTALYCAAFYGNTELVKNLIEYGADVNIATYKSVTPLMIATMLHHYEVMQILIEAGADTEIQDLRGDTPLLQAVTAGNTCATKILLAGKADSNAKTTTHNTPLMRAAKHAYFDIIKLLVEHGADVNYSYKGISVLDRAASCGVPEIIEFLKDAGAK